MGTKNNYLWICSIIMGVTVISLLIFATFLGIEVFGRKAQPGRRSRQLIFEDKFDSFDLSKWEHTISMSGGGNWEFQIYDNNRSNSYVKNGKLCIKPTLTSEKYGEAFLTSGTLNLNRGSAGSSCTDSSFFGCERRGTLDNIINPIMSARISTQKSFSFKYGTVHVRAKLPKGDWLWPAIWLLPETNFYGSWPTSGEIDIMEGRGNENLTNEKGIDIGVGQIGSTLHYGPTPSLNGWANAYFSKNLNGQNFNDDFHIFGLEWTPRHIKFTVDDETVGIIRPDEEGFWKIGRFPNNLENPWKQQGQNSKMAPFDQPFYLIINLAVGGTNGYFPETERKPWRNTSPTAMRDFWSARSEWLPTWKGEESALQIDYVRVWSE